MSAMVHFNNALKARWTIECNKDASRGYISSDVILFHFKVLKDLLPITYAHNNQFSWLSIEVLVPKFEYWPMCPSREQKKFQWRN